ncbi:hypothetical protein CRYUN_Cryun19dG0120900 [Craigia yunnanensis]
MYAENEQSDSAFQVFARMNERWCVQISSPCWHQFRLVQTYHHSCQGKLFMGTCFRRYALMTDTPIKYLDSWRSLTAAYGIHGNGRPALRAFTELNKSSPHKPNAITFTDILSESSHAGVVEGYEVFNRKRGYEAEPSVCGFHGNNSMLREWQRNSVYRIPEQSSANCHIKHLCLQRPVRKCREGESTAEASIRDEERKGMEKC